MLRLKAKKGIKDKYTSEAFLLLEVMIAVVVLAVGITLVLRSFNSAILAVKNTQDYTTAMFLLDTKMFTLETEKAEEMQAEGAFKDEFSKFSWKIERERLEGFPLESVNVAIKWKTAAGTKTLSAITFLQFYEEGRI